ncbi:MAG: hypothetical protein ABIE55_00380 [Candidatus Aenigmatarchaeota archaeon]
MKPKTKDLIDFEKKVFNIENESRPRGAWWWWFWLFFFNNPKNPGKPRQLMILWSTKNVKEIECNKLKIRLNRNSDRKNLDGAVAVWYFDGEKMNHNFVLEQCNLKLSGNELSSDSKTPTSFSTDNNKNMVKIGNDFTFIAESNKGHKFSMPVYRSNNYLGNVGYSILKMNRLSLRGKIRNEPISGSAYFQRVFVNAPSVPWYWGIFHFENGGILTYFNPHVFGKSIKKDISFFDGRSMHKFDNIKVRRLGKYLPTFLITGINEKERISFKVKSYSHSSWSFKKKSLGIIPNKLVYNEYPSVISDLKLTNNKTGRSILLKKLGKSVGNAEHTTGLLL